MPKRKPKKRQSGGLLRGPSHAQGGMPAIIGGKETVELEGGEYIIRKSSVDKYGEGTIARINQGLVDPAKLRQLKKGGKVKKQTGGRVKKSSNKRRYQTGGRTSNTRIYQNGGRTSSGTTSNVAGHVHTYSNVDEHGNGWTDWAVHPENSNIKHRHKVVNFLVRTAQSQCYPNCEELYGVQGAGPHTHNLGANITTEMENRNYKKGGSVTGRKKMPRKRVKRRMQMGGQTCPSGQRMQNGTCVSIGGTMGRTGGYKKGGKVRSIAERKMSRGKTARRKFQTGGHTHTLPKTEAQHAHHLNAGGEGHRHATNAGNQGPAGYTGMPVGHAGSGMSGVSYGMTNMGSQYNWNVGGGGHRHTAVGNQPRRGGVRQRNTQNYMKKGGTVKETKNVKMRNVQSFKKGGRVGRKPIKRRRR